MLAKQKWLFFEMLEKLKALKNVFFYDNTELENVDVFTYLGVNFKYNGKFDSTQNSIQAKTYLFLLLKRVKENSRNVETTLSLFDTYFSSVLNYGC